MYEDSAAITVVSVSGMCVTVMQDFSVIFAVLERHWWGVGIQLSKFPPSPAYQLYLSNDPADCVLCCDISVAFFIGFVLRGIVLWCLWSS